MGNIASTVFPSANKPEVRHFCMICNDSIEDIRPIVHCYKGYTSYVCDECERQLFEYKRRHSADVPLLVERIQQMREKHNKKTAVGLKWVEAHAKRGRTQLVRRSTRLSRPHNKLRLLS
jgi:DNA-directed RNA polymerase subunit RPC12/RpoP